MGIKVQFEKTDTFGGESNYSWVKRANVEFPDGTSDLSIFRKAKSWAGYSGLRGVKTDYGDSIDFRPYRICQVLFVTSAWDSDGTFIAAKDL